MKVGFTGTQVGMTRLQLSEVASMFFLEDMVEFHHGCCVGSDEQAHELAVDFDVNIIGHPPIITDKMMDLIPEEFFKLNDPLPYIVRNHRIVDATDCLIATPKTADEITRSGTWATVRYARKRGKPVMIVQPGGKTVYERW